jgi:ABC-2 type transport system ATP-binding protein
MAAVVVEGLTIAYGSVRAVQDLSFEAEAGEVTCVLGPNGAGKTSTIEALEGLRRPTGGHLSVLGLDPRADHRALAERMGVMLQEGGIHPGLRPPEVVRHAAAFYREPLAGGPLLERLGLAGRERRTYRQLSGGEQKRLALAAALVGRPQVAFLDEPTAGVDPAGRQVIRQVIADLRRDGVTVLLTTHDLNEAERVADRVVIVTEGRLVAAGPLEDLVRGRGTADQVRFGAPPGIDTAALSDHLGGVAVTETAPGDYAVDADPTPATIAAITAWLASRDLPLADLRAGRQRLEDVYLRLTAAPRAGTAESAGPPVRAEPVAAAPATVAGRGAGDEPAGESAPGEPAAAEPAGGEPTNEPTAAEPDEPAAGEPAPTPPAPGGGTEPEDPA